MNGAQQVKIDYAYPLNAPEDNAKKYVYQNKDIIHAVSPERKMS